METPIIDFVKNYINKDITRFHMPGHKGHMFFGWEPYDITEIEGADVLHHGTGIIRQSEKNAALLFGSGDTHYSTEGSTHAIKAMLCILKMERAGHRPQPGREMPPDTGTRPRRRMLPDTETQPEHRMLPDIEIRSERRMRPYILAARNVHRSMVDACALLDLDLEFIEHSREPQQYKSSQQDISVITPISSQSLLSHVVTPEALEKALQERKELPLGVYVTSPDYLGQLTDIAGLAEVCKQYSIPLLVDNAHGAYLHFLPEPIHPMDLGAAMCSDSAHKTLPVLTGGAYLHIHKEFTERFSPYASQALSLFGSTSPSYLTMQSLDWCNRYLAEGYRGKLAETVHKLQGFKENLACKGIAVNFSEPLKLVINTGTMGYTGQEIAHELREARIECEYADNQQVVLMLTPENQPRDWERLENWSDKTAMLHRKKPPVNNSTTSYVVVDPKTTMKKTSIPAPDLSLQKKNLIDKASPLPEKKATLPERALSLREAVFSAGEWVAVKQAEGRICAAETVSCPPAIPIAVSGEKISAEMIQEFLNAGIQEVFVVK